MVAQLVALMEQSMVDLSVYLMVVQTVRHLVVHLDDLRAE
jgi:hypothetical protein